MDQKEFRAQYVDAADSWLGTQHEQEVDLENFLAENYPAAKNAVSNIAAAINWDPKAAAAFALQLLEDVNYAGTDEVRAVIEKNQ